MSDQLIEFLKTRVKQTEKERNEARFFARLLYAALNENLGIFINRICPLCDGDEHHTSDCPIQKMKDWKL